jgi:hypothetical protein
MLLFLCCRDANVSAHKNEHGDLNLIQKEIRKTADNLPLSESSDSSVFFYKFQLRETPYEIKMDSPDWVGFISKQPAEISRNEVMNFLCNNDSNFIKDPQGGYYQYYYGYRLKLQNNFSGLIYYKTTQDYTGFVLSVFSTNGKLTDELFIAGTKGEYDPERQKECQINYEGQILITEIIVNNNFNYDSKPFDASCIENKYEINEIGKINLSESTNKRVKAVCSEENNNRIKVSTPPH